MTDYPPRREDGPEPSPSLVRPYARTGGRTRPVHDFDLEALVVTTVTGNDPAVNGLGRGRLRAHGRGAGGGEHAVRQSDAEVGR